ncbi:MAG: DPP IV N-terminal domain-containing protein [Candidatus Bathyarchaeia archaeon]
MSGTNPVKFIASTILLSSLLLCYIYVSLGFQQASAAFPGVNGKIIFYSDRDGYWRLYSINPDGTGLTQLTHGRMDGEPSWSPDGSRIVFTGWDDGDPEIYVVNADGSGRVQLTFNSVWDGEPSWSPDGSRIVFTGWDETTAIYIMNLDGSNRTRLTRTLAHEQHPSWSPDGGRIAFSSNRDGDYEIYIMNPDGTDIRKLTDNSEDDYSPSWSPDGKKIIFVSNRVTKTNPEGDSEIFMMDVENGDVTQLTFNTVDDNDPSWSPDGSKIAFTRYEVKGWPFVGWQLWTMNRDGSNQVQLTDTRSIIGSRGGSNWGPDWQPLTNRLFNLNLTLSGYSTITLDGKAYGNGTASLKPGTYRVRLEAPTGFTFLRWEVAGGVSVGGWDSPETTCTVLGDGSLKAVMVAGKVGGLTVPNLWPWVRIDQVVYPPEAGSIHSEPEPTYGVITNPWATYYRYNMSVIFTATPKDPEAWEFVEWELPGGVKTVDNPLHIVTVRDGYVKAIFRIRTVVEAPSQND